MGRIPDNLISEVMERADMLQIIGEYVRLKKAGRNHKGLCPFHSEKSPSFTVTPERGFFKCFGCGVGGTVYTFLMKAEGWSFPEAVRHVAARVGVEVPELNDEDAESARERRESRESYQKTLGIAQQWFETNLYAPEGAHALDYLRSRGVDEDAARAFGLGYAPESWSGLLDHLRRHRIGTPEAEVAGLAIQGQRGAYDRFRDRIIFPVVDIWGKAVAFGGRRLNDDDKAGAKYINSPETEFYTKGSQLYGLAATKRAIRAEGQALLVEGNFDVVVLYARGVQNAVAPMGTALTDRQARLLSRYTQRVFVAFDADKAGTKATARSLPILLAHKFDARVVVLPAGDDPDSLVQREGQEALQQAVDRARPIVAHAIDQIIAPLAGAPIEAKVSAIREVGAEILSHVEDAMTWKHYAEEIARRMDLPLAEAHRLLRRTSQQSAAGRAERAERDKAPLRALDPAPRGQDEPPAWFDEGPPPEDGAPGPRGDLLFDEGPALQGPRQPIPQLEGRCLQILADLPDRLGEFIAASCCQLMTDERLVNLIERVHERATQTGKAPEYALVAQQLAEELGDQDFFDQISALLCAERAWDGDRIEPTYLGTITTLQKQWLREEEKKIQRLLVATDLSAEAAMKILKRQKDLNKLRADLDVRLQRKRL